MSSNYRKAYNALLAGKTIRMPFETWSEYEKARSCLSSIHSRSHLQLAKLGMAELNEKQTLSMKFEGDPSMEYKRAVVLGHITNFVMLVSLGPPENKIKKEVKFEILD